MIVNNIMLHSPIRLVALLLVVMWLHAVDIPTSAQRVLDTLEQTMATAKKKAVADLTVVFKEQMRAEKLEAATAIKVEIDRLNKEVDAVEDLLGDAKRESPTQALIGKWAYVKNDGFKDTFEFKAGGVASESSANCTGKWVLNEKDKVIRVSWSNGCWEEFNLPIDPKGTSTNSSNRGKNSGTATKLP